MRPIRKRLPPTLEDTETAGVDEAPAAETPPAPEDTEMAGVDEAPVAEAQPAPEDTEMAGADEAPAADTQPDEEPKDQASLTEDRSDDTGATVAAGRCRRGDGGCAVRRRGNRVQDDAKRGRTRGSLVVDTVDYGR